MASAGIGKISFCCSQPVITYDIWQGKENLGWGKAEHKTTDNSMSLMLQGDTDSWWSRLPNLHYLGTATISSVGQLQKTACSACHRRSNGKDIKACSGTIFQTLWSIPLFCSALHIVSQLQDSENKYSHCIPLSSESVWFKHMLYVKSNAYGNKCPFLPPRNVYISFQFFKNVE